MNTCHKFNRIGCFLKKESKRKGEKNILPLSQVNKSLRAHPIKLDGLKDDTHESRNGPSQISWSVSYLLKFKKVIVRELNEEDKVVIRKVDFAKRGNEII